MQRWDKPNPLNTGLVPHPSGKWVAYADYEQALAEKDLALAQANRHKEELVQKLAEKDEELKERGRVIADLYHYKDHYEALCKQIHALSDWAPRRRQRGTMGFRNSTSMTSVRDVGA